MAALSVVELASKPQSFGVLDWRETPQEFVFPIGSASPERRPIHPPAGFQRSKE